jgi:hypothetical protein
MGSNFSQMERNWKRVAQPRYLKVRKVWSFAEGEHGPNALILSRRYLRDPIDEDFWFVTLEGEVPEGWLFPAAISRYTNIKASPAFQALATTTKFSKLGEINPAIFIRKNIERKYSNSIVILNEPADGLGDWYLVEHGQIIGGPVELRLP